MADPSPEKIGLPDFPKIIALIVLAGSSGFVVWSFHNFEWPGFVVRLGLAGFVGFIASGLVGVHLFPTLAMMGAMSGCFEGVYQGWQYYGWFGVVLGGLIGIVAAIAIVFLPVMLTQFVMVLRGFDPFVVGHTEEGTKGNIR